MTKLTRKPRPPKALAQPQRLDGLRELVATESEYDRATKVAVDKPLTEMQKAFVKHWAMGEGIATAAVKAGFAPTNAGIGYKMVRMPNILAAYEKEKKAYEAAAQMTRKKVMDGLLEAVEMARLMAEPQTMVAGWREIGKMCGYYEPVTKKIDVNVTGNVVMQRMERMTDAELLKFIQQGISNDESTSGDDGDDE